jgi:hypothetical protein
MTSNFPGLVGSGIDIEIEIEIKERAGAQN